MKIKPEWTTILHAIRRREIEIVFKNCPLDAFGKGLEIGAGDGFQSALLKPFIKRLVCTEYDPAKLTKSDQPGTEYRICDAERLLDEFKPGSFDLVFSSNVMEHLPHPGPVFHDLHALLKEGGVCVSIMPGSFIKFCWLAFFYPNQLVTLIEVLSQRRGSLVKLATGNQEEIGKLRPDLGNNPKTDQRSWLTSQLWPQPHGVYPSHWQEWKGFRKSRWKKLIEEAGFTIIAMKKMPVSSGYGFGLNRLRRLFERLGFTYGYAFIAVKAGKGKIPEAASYFS